MKAQTSFFYIETKEPNDFAVLNDLIDSLIKPATLIIGWLKWHIDLRDLTVAV